MQGKLFGSSQYSLLVVQLVLNKNVYLHQAYTMANDNAEAQRGHSEMTSIAWQYAITL
jgi:hypothetical protein